MEQPRKTSKGFTILELMITVIIAGIIAAFAIPDYTASLDRAIEKDIIAQMNVIHAAQNSYFARNGNQYMPTTTSLDLINNTLGLHIIPNGNTYSMVRNAGGTTYALTVSRGGSTAMTIRMTNAAWNPTFSGTPGNPWCVASCPSLM